jgi:hypothetical protein
VSCHCIGLVTELGRDRGWQGDNLGLALRLVEGFKTPIRRLAFPGALRAAGASRTYHRAFPAANGLSGTSGALDSLDGNSYPPIHA